MPLLTIYSYIIAVSFIGGGNWIPTDLLQAGHRGLLRFLFFFPSTLKTFRVLGKKLKIVTSPCEQGWQKG
jgi:Na+/pantothenate symporter